MKSHFQFTVIQGGKPNKVTTLDIQNMQRAWFRMMWMPFDVAVAVWLAPFEVFSRTINGTKV